MSSSAGIPAPGGANLGRATRPTTSETTASRQLRIIRADIALILATHRGEPGGLSFGDDGQFDYGRCKNYDIECMEFDSFFNVGESLLRGFSGGRLR
jgi:hypothetical protein